MRSGQKRRRRRSWLRVRTGPGGWPVAIGALRGGFRYDARTLDKIVARSLEPQPDGNRSACGQRVESKVEGGAGLRVRAKGIDRNAVVEIASMTLDRAAPGVH